MSTDAELRYQRLHPIEAVLDAWSRPGFDRHLHPATRREITRLSPQLALALNRLQRGHPVDNRDTITKQATESVAGSLLALYGEARTEPGGGAELVDGHTDDERWRRAVAIVDELVRAGLI